MKRTLRLVWAAILAFHFVLGGGACALAEENPTEMTLKFGSAFQYAVQGENLWIVQGQDVEIYTKDGKQEVSSFQLNYESAHIAANGTGAFLLNASDQSIEHVTIAGDVIASWNVPAEIHIAQMEATDENLYLLSAQEETRSEDEFYSHFIHGTLYVLQLDDGNIRQSEAAQDISAISVNGSSVCAYNAYDGRLTLLDADANIAQNTYESVVADYVSITPSGEIYLLAAGLDVSSISRLDRESGQIRKLATIQAPAAGLRTDGVRLYSQKWEANELVLLTLPSEAAGEQSPIVITIGFEGSYDVNDERLNCAISMTQQAYPECQFEFAQLSNPETVLSSLMTGDGTYDILFLMNSGGIPDAADLYHSGALANLSNSSEITDALHKMIDLNDQFSWDNNLYAIPAHSSVQLFWINQTLFTQLGLPQPEAGWTWDDFFELGAQVKELRDNGSNVLLLKEYRDPFFLMQYHVNELNHGVLDYRDPEFMRILEQYKVFVDAGVILNNDDAMYDDPFSENTLFAFGDWVSHSQMGELMGAPVRTYIVPPVYAENTHPVVNWQTASVNIHSEHPEICCAFLANYLSKDALLMDTVTWSEGLLLKDSEFADVTGRTYDSEMWPTEEREAFWLSLLETGVRRRVIPEFINEQRYKLFSMYMNGEITLDEFCDSSQERVDMAMEE